MASRDESLVGTPNPFKEGDIVKSVDDLVPKAGSRVYRVLRVHNEILFMEPVSGPGPYVSDNHWHYRKV